MSSFMFSDYIPIIEKPEIQYGLTPNQSFYDNEKKKKTKKKQKKKTRQSQNE